MEAGDRAWLLLREAAERYGRMAVRVRSERDAWALRLASMVLERGAYALLVGKVDYTILEDLRMVEIELARRRLPVDSIKQAIRILASRLARTRPSIVTWESLDLLGLPA